MSAYETALRRYREAGTDAERDEAARVLRCFAVDPYYNPDRQKVMAS